MENPINNIYDKIINGFYFNDDNTSQLIDSLFEQDIKNNLTTNLIEAIYSNPVEHYDLLHHILTKSIIHNSEMLNTQINVMISPNKNESMSMFVLYLKNLTQSKRPSNIVKQHLKTITKNELFDSLLETIVDEHPKSDNDEVLSLYETILELSNFPPKKTLFEKINRHTKFKSIYEQISLNNNIPDKDTNHKTMKI